MRGNGIRWITAVIAFLFFISPLYYIVWLSFNPTENIWPHLVKTLLPSYLKNSIILMVGSGLLSLILGVTSAWTITHYQFPTRKILTWAILLPFSVPAYIIAYIYTDLLEYSGVIQGQLRLWFGWNSPRDYWFPEIRSLGGAILLFSLVLYPYIYLLARKAFLEQSDSLRKSAEVLGCSKWKIFFSVSLPLARPAIMVSVFLVMMETLSDFGTVEYFSLNTLSLGAYNVWMNMGNVGGAAQIACLTLMVVFLLLFVERLQRARQKQIEKPEQYKEPVSIGGYKKYFVIIFNWSLIGFGFLIPFFVLVRYTTLSLFSNASFRISITEYLHLSKNSLLVALVTAFLSVFVSFILIRYVIDKRTVMKWLVPFFSMGYALPGTILGIGVLAMFTRFNEIWGSTYLLASTLIVVLIAYLIRFLSIPIGTVDSGLNKISDNVHQAARILSRDQWQPMFEIDLPLIKKSLFTGFLIVFVDVMKELPLMLILRPLNYETLATQVYNFASDESIEQACLSALTIVLVGILPVIMLTKSIEHKTLRQIELKRVT